MFMIDRMLLNSDDSELLIAFEQGKTVEKTAQIVGKDPSGVSRQLLRISRTCPALEKVSGKWALTDTGRRLCYSIKEFINLQRHIVAKKGILRIGTNREFGSRIIGPRISELNQLFPNTYISISTFELGTEDALLNGMVDLSIDCEKPIDPEIGFRHLLSDPIIAVCSPSFFKKHRKSLCSDKIFSVPHLLCNRLFPHRIVENVTNVNSVFSFNDIATTRAACIVGNGWALLPRYTVKDELKKKVLITIEGKAWASTKYGLWWSRERFSEIQSIKLISNWLKSIKI